MSDRTVAIGAFLTTAGWGHAERRLLAADASKRNYHRLIDTVTGQSAVLMDAPPERGEDVRPFIAVAEHLRAIGLSAPGILARDADRGLLLLEDMGDGLVARLADADPSLEQPLYEASTDVLTELHRHPPLPDIPDHPPEAWAGFAALAFETYAPAFGSRAAPDPATFIAEMTALWATHTGQRVMILRDYHAENLLWLPNRAWIRRVGLLDFQDAQTGPRAYDLISLLEDARREVPEALREALIDRYVTQNDLDPATFRQQCAVVSAQRHLRILGVFARLIAGGKPRYAAFLPRTWAHLARTLKMPGMGRLADIVLSTLPAPEPERLARLVRA